MEFTPAPAIRPELFVMSAVGQKRMSREASGSSGAAAWAIVRAQLFCVIFDYLISLFSNEPRKRLHRHTAESCIRLEARASLSNQTEGTEPSPSE